VVQCRAWPQNVRDTEKAVIIIFQTGGVLAGGSNSKNPAPQGTGISANGMSMRSPLTRERDQPRLGFQPCQAIESTKVPTGPQWIHELKHDGFPIDAHKDGDDVRLWSRNGRDWSVEFVAITAAVMALPFARPFGTVRADFAV
jgi:hypothetical protein